MSIERCGVSRRVAVRERVRDRESRPAGLQLPDMTWPGLRAQFSGAFVYAGRSTLENARRYDSGLVPTTVPKCSRITAADPKPASAATCSWPGCRFEQPLGATDPGTRQPRGRRRSHLLAKTTAESSRAHRCLPRDDGSGSSRERFSSIHASNGVMAPGASAGGACSMNCACPPARSSGITASRATDAAMSAPKSRRTM